MDSQNPDREEDSQSIQNSKSKIQRGIIMQKGRKSKKLVACIDVGTSLSKIIYRIGAGSVRHLTMGERKNAWEKGKIRLAENIR
jgi:hypothetical protein